MRWYLAGAAMLAACGFSADDATSVARFVHFQMGCPIQGKLAACPSGGRFDRTSGTLTFSECATSGLVLDGEGIAVDVSCTQTAGTMDVAGTFTTQDGDTCDMSFSVRSVISQTCSGLFGATPCETSWTISGAICGHRVDETCTGNEGFLSFPDCH